MPTNETFLADLEAKVSEQLRAQRVGYLLGAGSSYLDGAGYPLANELWDQIQQDVSDAEGFRTAIQEKLDAGASGLEEALDLLDDGQIGESTLRHVVREAIAELLVSRCPDLAHHRTFVRGIVSRSDSSVRIFSLNYDPCIERAAELEGVRVVDGFIGHEHAFFNPGTFEETPMVNRGPRARAMLSPCGVSMHLYKLHGSLGWYECPTKGVRRCGFAQPLPEGTIRLMVPPQKRKSSDVVRHPYSPIWTAFRGALSQDAKPLNRLAALGYGFSDEHVNDVIEAALRRSDFTLLLFARSLSDVAFTRWSSWRNAIVVTQDRCSLKGYIGPGHPDLWSFERIAREVNR